MLFICIFFHDAQYNFFSYVRLAQEAFLLNFVYSKYFYKKIFYENKIQLVQEKT
jgi:hypothetical protein